MTCFKKKDIISDFDEGIFEGGNQNLNKSDNLLSTSG
jgi:hypothetical protein